MHLDASQLFVLVLNLLLLMESYSCLLFPFPSSSDFYGALVQYVLKVTQRSDVSGYVHAPIVLGP